MLILAAIQIGHNCKKTLKMKTGSRRSSKKLVLDQEPVF